MNLKSEQHDKPDGWPSGFSESPHDFFCLSFPHHGLFLLGPPLGPKASAWLEHLGMVPTLSSFSMGIAVREASPFASADSASTKDQLPGRSMCVPHPHVGYPAPILGSFRQVVGST
ncbi:hypothetical protein CSPX01_15218 [Colletotrichum filicis]|nr:hypothetical protein CSPX01_15218 [Colletotrichum filicis]